MAKINLNWCKKQEKGINLVERAREKLIPVVSMKASTNSHVTIPNAKLIVH